MEFDDLLLTNYETEQTVRLLMEKNGARFSDMVVRMKFLDRVMKCYGGHSEDNRG